MPSLVGYRIDPTRKAAFHPLRTSELRLGSGQQHRIWPAKKQSSPTNAIGVSLAPVARSLNRRDPIGERAARLCRHTRKT